MFIAVGIQTFSKWITVLSYEINKDYIAKNICINREVQGNCCKGKCYLQKKLASDDDQQKPFNKTTDTKDIQSDFYLQELVRISFEIKPAINHRSPFYINGISQEYIASVFQPPPFSAV